MARFDLADYNGNYVMSCEDEEQAKIFCTYLNKAGHRWSGGESYLRETFFEMYKHDMVYYFNDDCYGSLCNVSDKYTVLHFDDFEWDGYRSVKSLDLDVSFDEMFGLNT